MAVWLITGASSGFGRSLMEAALARGDSVGAAARNVSSFEAGERVLPVQLDVTVAAQRDAAVAAVIERFGRVLRSVKRLDEMAYSGVWIGTVAFRNRLQQHSDIACGARYQTDESGRAQHET